MTTSYKERFNLRKDYYVQIDPRITVTLLSTMWGLLPLLAFFPNALDMVLNDTVADFIEENRFILVKFFNVQVWVSCHCRKMYVVITVIYFICS